MRTIDPKEQTPGQLLSLITGGIAPRPIALVSTISEEGVNNLAPFSFFNGFGCNPPVVVFSPARRGRDGTQKDTYNNLMKTKECVVQVVTYDIVDPVNISSADFEHGVDEFKKSGLTPVDSERIKPKRVKESPFQMECKLMQMIPLGETNGSGNLAICEVILFHVAERVFEGDLIHPDKIDLVGRNSGAFYTRATGGSIFEVPRPISPKIIGYEGLPGFLKDSKHFTGNQLSRLSNVEKIPSNDDVISFAKKHAGTEAKDVQFNNALKEKNIESMIQTSISLKNQSHPKSTEYLEKTAQYALEAGKINEAWHLVLFSQL